MPYLRLNLSIEPSADLAAQLASRLTTLTVELLGKKKDLTAVSITSTPAGFWFIGTQVVSPSCPTFYLDIKVTEGTNTKNEKAHYVQAVFDAVAEMIGPLAPASYIVIDEVHADAWGYSGQTQEFRYIQGKPL